MPGCITARQNHWWEVSRQARSWACTSTSSPSSPAYGSVLIIQVSSALAGLKLMLVTAPQTLGQFADLQHVLDWAMRSAGYYRDRYCGDYGLSILVDDERNSRHL